MDPAYTAEQAYTVSKAGGLKGILLDQKAVLEFGTGLECPLYDLQEITEDGEIEELPPEHALELEEKVYKANKKIDDMNLH